MPSSTCTQTPYGCIAHGGYVNHNSTLTFWSFLFGRFSCNCLCDSLQRSATAMSHAIVSKVLDALMIYSDSFSLLSSALGCQQRRQQPSPSLRPRYRPPPPQRPAHMLTCHTQCMRNARTHARTHGRMHTRTHARSMCKYNRLCNSTHVHTHVRTRTCTCTYALRLRLKRRHLHRQQCRQGRRRSCQRPRSACECACACVCASVRPSVCPCPRVNAPDALACMCWLYYTLHTRDE